ncbi:hypothetical protein WME95_26290 [Sorangium sp. So ce327]|jgi:hypothetical protein|uniref:hypothetical protein n=1 Tax=Sorangium sp. So ce327 TaxID=3133301 RepID=UPI003F5EF47A
MRSFLRALTHWQATPVLTLALLCLHCGSSVEADAMGGGSTGEGGGGSSTSEGSVDSTSTGEGGGGSSSGSGAGGSTGEGSGGSAGEGGSSTGEGGGGSSTGAGGGGGGCRLPVDPAVFEIGTGETCFESIEEGATLPVMAGPQGGYHLWFAVGCSDCGTRVRVRYSVKDPATGDLFPPGVPQEGMVELLPGEFPHAFGLIAFLPGRQWQPETVLKEGTHVILAAEARNDDGSTKHTAEVEVVLGATVAWGLPCSDDPATCDAPGGAPCCTD